MQNNPSASSRDSLESFLENVTGDSHLRVQDDLGDGFVRLKAAEAQRRQAKQDIRSFEDVVIEMLRNSRDAHAHTIFVATWKENTNRHLTIIDDGSGIPASLHNTVFEPFVTSKLDSFHSDRWGVHGRGMALYSIKENTDKAYIVQSDKSRGAVFHVEASAETLTEKRDQSSFPVVTYDENNTLVLRGPHNIIRTIMEFAIDERKTIQVYFGSPVEIASALYFYYLSKNAESAFSLSPDFSSLNFCEHLSHALDPEHFSEIASSLTLPLSSRSARRIMDGEIKPTGPILSLLDYPNNDQKDQKNLKQDTLPAFNPSAHQRKLKISPEDMEAFKEKLQNAYAYIADAYYLNTSVEPKVKTSKDKITVTFEIEQNI